MKNLIIASTAAALALCQSASAQNIDMEEDEVAALVRFAMPKAFQGLQQTCRTQLDANAYIYSSGPQVSAKLSSAANGSWTTARGAILAMVERENPDMAPLLNSMPPDSLRPFAEELIAGLVVQKLDAGKCVQIDRILALLDPLPAENLAALAAMAYAESQQNEAAGDLSL